MHCFCQTQLLLKVQHITAVIYEVNKTANTSQKSHARTHARTHAQISDIQYSDAAGVCGSITGLGFTTDLTGNIGSLSRGSPFCCRSNIIK